MREIYKEIWSTVEIKYVISLILHHVHVALQRHDGKEI